MDEERKDLTQIQSSSGPLESVEAPVSSETQETAGTIYIAPDLLGTLDGQPVAKETGVGEEAGIETVYITDQGSNTDGLAAPEAPVMNEHPEVKKKAPVMQIVMGTLFVLLIGLSIYIAIYVSEGMQKKDARADKSYESGDDDPWDEILGDDGDEDKSKKEDKKESKKEDSKEKDEDQEINLDREDDSGEEKTQESTASARDSIDWDNDEWDKPYENHRRSEYDGKEYYEEFEDSIDTEVDYNVVREFDKIYDKKLGVCLRCSYIQLEGDNIPNLDDINEKLKGYGRYYLDYYDEKKDTIDSYLENNDTAFIGKSESIVPFNDEENISIIIQDDVRLGGEVELHLTCVNINLTTGTVLDNSSILNLPEEFGRLFRERSNKQNGRSAGVEEFSDSQILSMLRDSKNLIVFYTPVGIEIGYEYKGTRSSGWVTISLRDYQKYMWGM